VLQVRTLICALALALGCGGGSATVTSPSPDSPIPDSASPDNPPADGPSSPQPCDAGLCKNGGRCFTRGGVATCTCAPPDVWGGPDCANAIGAEVTSISISQNPVAGAAVTFQARLFDPGAVATSVMWTFGDGAALADSALQRNGSDVNSIVDHTFAAPGSHTVTASTTVVLTSTATTTAGVTAPIGSCAKTSWTVTTPGFQYAFDGNAGNPGIVVCLGQTMTFHLDNISVEHPFCIWNGNNQNDAPGVVNNCVSGTTDVVWNVPASLPDGARYRCNVHFFGSAFIPK
jgi:hypothetical protein